MLYDYIINNYKDGEPIFFSDLCIEGISRSAVNQQLRLLCYYGKLMKYDTGVYYIPKKTSLKSAIGPTADMVAKYRFISKGKNVDGFYSGNTFANHLGISTQVPRIVEIVTNNTNSSPREVKIGGRKFRIKKPPVTITADNVYVLQMLDLLKNLDAYLDGTYADAKERFTRYIELHKITRPDIDQYIRRFPTVIFRYYYELELDHVLA